MALPWDDNGYRVLRSAAYMDHTVKMRALANQFTPAVDALAREFGTLVEQAKVRLGGLFRPEDYPAPDELRSKFSFETKVMPLPDAGDFRVTLGEEEKERIKRRITANVEASLQVAGRDLWQRLYEAVSHLAERLQAYKVTEEGVEHAFRDYSAWRTMPSDPGDLLRSRGNCRSKRRWSSRITRHSLVRVYRLLRKPRSWSPGRKRLNSPFNGLVFSSAFSFIAKVASR